MALNNLHKNTPANMELEAKRKEMMEVDDLRKRIGRLTDRVVVSRDLNYLRMRYAALKKKKSTGVRMPNAKRADRAEVISVSLTHKRRELLVKACKDRREGVSAVLRDAFDAWLAANGYKVEIEHIKRLERDLDGG